MPPASPRPVSAPVPPGLPAGGVVGVFRRLPVENGWHVGTISLAPLGHGGSGVGVGAGAGEGGNIDGVANSNGQPLQAPASPGGAAAGAAGASGVSGGAALGDGDASRFATALRWTNEAGVFWDLFPTSDPDVLATGDGNPYKDRFPEFGMQRDGHGDVCGFAFQSELYWRDGASVLPQQSSGGLKGYISMALPRNHPNIDADYREGFGYGVSFWVNVWPLIEAPIASFQIGLPSTWISPDNADFFEPLCPPSTLASQWADTRGPYFRDVFQTIEGGLGYWCSTRFGATSPKYRINGTPNGYNHEVSTPGFGFGSPEFLRGELAGLAALSNRLLIPPDGFTFPAPPHCKGMLGNAWMALALTPPRTHADGHSTGDLCWTLFLESDNFCGPVAFWVPEIWSTLSKGYTVIDGRGLDARPGLCRGAAMEVNTVPFFEAKGDDGATYARVPRLSFPVDNDGVTVLMRDVLMYPEAPLFAPTRRGELPRAPLRTASAKAWAPPMTVRPWELRHGGRDREGAIGSAGPVIEGIDAYAEPVAIQQETRSAGDAGGGSGGGGCAGSKPAGGAGGGTAFALKWKADPSGVTTAVGEGFRNLPEFLVTRADGTCAAVPQAPPSTRLADQAFRKHDLRDEYVLPDDVTDAACAAAAAAAAGVAGAGAGLLSARGDLHGAGAGTASVASAASAASEQPPSSSPPSELGPHTATLSDGSVLTFVWCRFVDQPSLAHLEWTAEERDRLQATVEAMHREWAGTACALPERSGSEPLAKLDPAQLVTPPRGCEVGFVPVVLRQHRPPAAAGGHGEGDVAGHGVADVASPMAAAAAAAAAAVGGDEGMGDDDDEDDGAVIEHRTRSYTVAMDHGNTRVQSVAARDGKRGANGKPYHRVVGGIVMAMDAPNPEQAERERRKRGKRRRKGCEVM